MNWPTCAFEMISSLPVWSRIPSGEFSLKNTWVASSLRHLEKANENENSVFVTHCRAKPKKFPQSTKGHELRLKIRRAQRVSRQNSKQANKEQVAG